MKNYQILKVTIFRIFSSNHNIHFQLTKEFSRENLSSSNSWFFSRQIVIFALISPKQIFSYFKSRNFPHRITIFISILLTEQFSRIFQSLLQDSRWARTSTCQNCTARSKAMSCATFSASVAGNTDNWPRSIASPGPPAPTRPGV